MDLTPTAAHEEFRVEVRRWLADDKPPLPMLSGDSRDQLPVHLAWERKLFDGGLAPDNVASSGAASRLGPSHDHSGERIREVANPIRCSGGLSTVGQASARNCVGKPRACAAGRISGGANRPAMPWSDRLHVGARPGHVDEAGVGTEHRLGTTAEHEEVVAFAVLGARN